MGSAGSEVLDLPGVDRSPVSRARWLISVWHCFPVQMKGMFNRFILVLVRFRPATERFLYFDCQAMHAWLRNGQFDQPAVKLVVVVVLPGFGNPPCILVYRYPDNKFNVDSKTIENNYYLGRI